MPIRVRKDRYGPYVQFGNRTRYYFSPYDFDSYGKAYNRALKQAGAIFMQQYANKKSKTI